MNINENKIIKRKLSSFVGTPPLSLLHFSLITNNFSNTHEYDY